MWGLCFNCCVILYFLFVISHICTFAEEGNTPKRSKHLEFILDGKFSLDFSLTVEEGGIEEGKSTKKKKVKIGGKLIEEMRRLGNVGGIGIENVTHLDPSSDKK